jgi:hypothetical protein
MQFDSSIRTTRSSCDVLQLYRSTLMPCRRSSDLIVPTTPLASIIFSLSLNDTVPSRDKAELRHDYPA